MGITKVVRDYRVSKDCSGDVGDQFISFLAQRPLLIDPSVRNLE